MSAPKTAAGYVIGDARPWPEQNIDTREGRACELRREHTPHEYELEAEYRDFRNRHGYSPTLEQEHQIWWWEELACIYVGAWVL